MSCFPVTGVILQFETKKTGKRRLLPRYGSYSDKNLQIPVIKSCFPVMGVILASLVYKIFPRALFPRYGGYSTFVSLIGNTFCVVSPLWGLF